MIDVTIESYTSKYQQQVIELIVTIQSKEFGVPIVAEDQPDLKNIPHYYQKGSGNFWLALTNEKVLGTISLHDIGDKQVALRKMFVKKNFRGKPLNIGQNLMNTALVWSKKHQISDVFLGTVPNYYAAHRFYEKNGFNRIDQSNLPSSFTIMEVDKYFYTKSL